MAQVAELCSDQLTMARPPRPLYAATVPSEYVASRGCHLLKPLPPDIPAKSHLRNPALNRLPADREDPLAACAPDH
jgi:hypothetical protein